MTTPVPAIARAPHRLPFLLGAANLTLAMAWWAAWLFAARWPDRVPALPQPAVPAGWLHAFTMQYQMLPSFMFGFLLTVFPRWMGLPELPRSRYLPVGLGLFGGQLVVLCGVLGVRGAIVAGTWLSLAGWCAGLVMLGLLLRRERGTTWHARSCYAALLVGFAGALAWAAWLHGADAWWAFASIKIGSFGLLLPMYATVAHRMFPFFAGNAVKGYVAWRPMWVLAAFWLLCLAHLVLELAHAYAWTWPADLGLFLLSTGLLWRWWPRGKMPALLAVLFVGLAWLPLAFALYAAQSLGYLMTGVYALGRAPAHALFIGFFASVLVAMVTRVTQGHSGRALEMPAVAWLAFAVVQVCAVLRIGAEIAPDAGGWQFFAALTWLVALLPWALHIGRIVSVARVDGGAG